MVEGKEEFLVATARAAGEILIERRASGNSQPISDGPEGLVTIADLDSEAAIRGAILAAFPGHKILSEEDLKHRTLRSYALPAEDYLGDLWIVDPLDGTANYARGSARVAVSIAYARDGVVEAGAVHAPFLGTTYSSTRGNGASYQDSQIPPRRPVALEEAIVGTGLAHGRDDRPAEAQRFGRLIRSSRDIRRTGCPSLDICDVATGVLDAHTEDLAAWDIAAASLIAREAHAEVHHLRARPETCPSDLFGLGFLIGAPAVAQALARVLGPS